MLLSVIGVGALPMISCTKNDEKKGNNDTPLSENAFSYNGVESSIASVVYAVDEESLVYSIYFSSVQGIADLESMLQADDYILIKTSAPTGNIDLTAEWNSLVYKNIKVSPETAADVTRSTLSLQFTSTTSVQMSLDVAMASGETLEANYDGSCICHVEEVPTGDAIVLDTPLFSWWVGQTSLGPNDYYFAMSNVKTHVQYGTSIAMSEPGYALVLDCYMDSGSQWQTFPTGTFKESNSNADHTYYSYNSFAVYFDGMNYTTMPLSGDVVISRGENNLVRVSAAFLDNDGVKHPISFEGDLRVGNGTTMPTLPHLMRDVEIKGFYAQGTYEGDVNDTGSGLSEVFIIDEAGDNNQPNSYGLNVAVFSTKFLDPRNERKLVAGTYTASYSGEQGTWVPTSEMTILGMVIPLGTYAAFTPEDDGTQTAYYSYPVDGTIEIEETGTNRYTIHVDLLAQTGYTIKGGIEDSEIYLTDTSDDDDNDGSSTLTSDLDLDLNHVKQANCFPQSKVYVEGLGYVDVDKITTIAAPAAPEECGYQYIDLGLVTGVYEHDPTGEYDDPGKLVAGDIFRLDLLVNPGDEDKITPGTYTVSPNRYLVSMWPGVCYRGVQLEEGHVGSRWLDISSAIGNGYPSYYHDPTYFVIDGWLNIPSVYGYASLYEGTVTITKADGGDNWFTFEIDGQDVLHHKIRGSWTGPVVLGNSDTPVVDSGKHFEADASSPAKTNEAAATPEPQGRSRVAKMIDCKNAQPLPKQPVQRVTFR